MNRLSLAPIAILVFTAAAYGQSVARAQPASASILESAARTEAGDHTPARAIEALRRLDRDVIIYRSLGDFEAEEKLARVSYEDFAKDLQGVITEVEPTLSRMPQSRLKNEIQNALDSYRDGAFWWQKIHRSKVVHVSALTAFESSRTTSDTAFLASVPYTVAIHWRQAGQYLKRAEDLMSGARK
jgi:hypothetical protein